MTKDELMALADAYAEDHRAAVQTGKDPRAALEAALDEFCRDIRIERDALRQAWEGSKQIIKMLEADKDGARYRLLRELSDDEIKAEFAKMYPRDIGILELAENNRDFAVEAIGARHHWAAFKAGARAVLKAAR